MTHETTNARYAGRLMRLAGMAMAALGRCAKVLPSFGRAKRLDASKPQRADGDTPMAHRSRGEMIARRALMTGNRNRDQAARYTRVHTILDRGR